MTIIIKKSWRVGCSHGDVRSTMVSHMIKGLGIGNTYYEYDYDPEVYKITINSRVCGDKLLLVETVTDKVCLLNCL